MSDKKTSEKIKKVLFGPGMTSDIRNFCRSYDVCLHTTRENIQKPYH